MLRSSDVRRLDLPSSGRNSSSLYLNDSVLNIALQYFSYFYMMRRPDILFRWLYDRLAQNAPGIQVLDTLVYPMLYVSFFLLTT